MPYYKEIEYYLDNDNLWKVKIDDSIIIIALDDSKVDDNRVIRDKKNNEKSCREYIDWLLE
jgi:hypothetical protein